ncbi:MAG: ABC transporter ATP-binding protein, partial [Clostridiales bacterium]|nr:ABC transporter ATP-binding protein [Clostridiales bacterium]
MSILETDNLKKIYGTGENTVNALAGVNLQVEKG